MDNKSATRPWHFTKDFCDKLISEHGDTMNAARAVHTQCLDKHGKQPTPNAVSIWIHRGRRGETTPEPTPGILRPADLERLNQIANALDKANIPVDEIGRIDHVKIRSGFHEVVTKDQDGKPVVTHAESKHVAIMLNPKFLDGPEWPVIQPARPVAIKNPVTTKRKSTDYKTIVVLSDLQVGFLRDIEDANHLIPMHDLSAINVALQIVTDLQPNQLGYVGDFLDLPEMSRWLQVEEFWRTTQPAIDEGYKILTQFEAAAGPRAGRDPTQFISGNHDRRLREYAVKNARAAFNLRPAAETPESWPDLSIPRLLRFSDLGMEYVGEYPGGEFWITPRLVVRHNPEGKEGYDASVIAGHTHHVRRETFSRRTPEGAKLHTLYEIGCLCSLDNYSDKRSLLATTVPSNRSFHRNWAHGFAVVTVDKEGFHSVEQVDIEKGRSFFRGKLYQASPTV
jgi:metallophosphoesterase superfamily enzyme